jgi:predicted metal-dependent phosphoesterase TrpH
MIDLHTHTCYSDGRAEPAELVRAAAEMGLTALAITDHDNTRGSRIARALILPAGLELVPGIELTTAWQKCTSAYTTALPDVDLLAYFVDFDSPAFQALEQDALEDIYARMRLACLALSGRGYPIAFEELFEVNPYYAGILQLIDKLVRKELVADWQSGTTLVDAIWSSVRPAVLGIEAAIAAVHAAGGMAVLAHPSIVSCGQGWVNREQLRPIVEAGLDGLEIYHHRLNPDARRHFSGLAEYFGLLMTGGSDEHGWPQGFPRLGSQKVGPEVLEALRPNRSP